MCLSQFCNYLDGEERAGCLTVSFWCLVIVIVLWLFATVPWVGLQCVIVVFPDHTLLIFDLSFEIYLRFNQQP